MKILATVTLTCLVGGCAINNANNPHENALAKPAPEAGPTLCMDGTPPPCTPRS